MIYCLLWPRNIEKRRVFRTIQYLYFWNDYVTSNHKRVSESIRRMAFVPYKKHSDQFDQAERIRITSMKSKMFRYLSKQINNSSQDSSTSYLYFPKT